MNLQEFRRTRVVMAPDQFEKYANLDFSLPEDTARVYVYKDGLYIRELIDGTFHFDLDATNIKCFSLEEVEVDFWTLFAEQTMNPDPRLSKEAIIYLEDLKRAQINLTEHWMNHDVDSEILHEDYPEILEFQTLTYKLSKWIDELIADNK